MAHFLLENYEALGTLWYIEIFDTENIYINVDDLKRVESQIKKTITDFEQEYSRFLETSKLTELNKKRKVLNPTAEFRTLIEKGLEYYQNTEGVFNFGIADKLTNQGYGKILINPKEEIKSQNLTDSVEISKNHIALKNNITLDLGGFGKGFLIDKLAHELLRTTNIKYFLINGGGDIYVTSNNEEPIEIYLQNPVENNVYKYSVKLKNAAICGSSTYKRSWSDSEGNPRTHIINSINTEQRVKDGFSFVSAKDCITADMLATTVCIRNDDEFITKLKSKYSFTII